MRFAFRIGNHFGFSDDANFGALIDEISLSRHPVAVQRTHGDTPSAVFPTTGEGSKLMRWQRRWSFHHSDALLHRLLHLLEGTHAYLARTRARRRIRPRAP